MAQLTIVIPSKNERFLRPTILDVLAKATGDVAIYPVLDGYEPPAEELVGDPRVTYLRFPPTRQSKKRQAINTVAALATGEYLMSLDAHCLMAPGFDDILIRDHQPDWVSVPRRQRLDAENWCLQTQVDNRPPIDYEYLMWPKKFEPPALHGFKWDARTLARAALVIDDIITFQGSCWLMTLAWFRRCGFMQVEGYQGWGQEAEEEGLTTWYNGGRVVVNKNTYYAHLHKGPKYGRMYFLDKYETDLSYRYAYDLWVQQRRDFFVSLVERFAPMPGWPANWQKELYA